VKKYTQIIYLSLFTTLFAVFAQNIQDIRPLNEPLIRREDPWRPMVSQRNILNLDRPSPWGLPRVSRHFAVDTVKILAIRVEFQPDNTTRTTGDGTFDLSPIEEMEHPFDPTPHNKAYFESHMQALKNYYLAISDSQLYVEWQVFPAENDSAYRLPDSMGYYGELGWMGGNMAERMQQFSKDAWELAIESGDFDINDNWDSFLIFHAGSDWQNDVASIRPDLVEIWPEIFVPSPDDLPTGYLKLPFDIDGIISDCIIMPEHSWQDGQIVCLNGVIAHEFGHQLGLVDLYSTQNFITQVGDFSLMDNGFGVGADVGVDFDKDGNVSDDEYFPVYGLFPAYPCAWDRAYLGWEVPVVITSDTDSVVIEACELPMNTGTTLLKIPINSYEYFLIENRQYDIPGDAGFYTLTRDTLTGVVLGALAVDTTSLSSAYDFLLPGDGLLIWHIDETVAYSDVDGNGTNNFWDNTLQWDTYRKFVALEEADGYEDLGVIVTYGEDKDYFYYPNNTVFSPQSNPSSDGNDGGKTGVKISSIGFSQSEMHFNISFDNLAPTPNIVTTIYPLYAPMVAADLDDDDIDEIITEGYISTISGYKGCLLIWDSQGEPFIDNGIVVDGYEYDDNQISVPYPVAVQTLASRITLPAIGDITGDGLNEIAAIDIEGNVHAWNPRTIGTDGFMTELSGFPVSLGSEASRSVSLWDIDSDGDQEIIVFTEEEWYSVDSEGSILVSGDARGEISGIAPSDQGLYVCARRESSFLYLFDWEGNPIWNTLIDAGDISYIVRADLDSDGSPHEIACIGRSGSISVIDSDGDLLNNYPVVVDDTSLSSAIAVDFNKSGTLDLLMAGRDGLYTYNQQGFPLENSPFSVSNVLAPPIYDGQNVIMASGDGVIYGLNRFGEMGDNYPLNAAPSNATPCLFRDSDGSYGLALGSTNGSLLIWNHLVDSLKSGAFPMWGSDAAHTFLQSYIPQGLTTEDKTEIRSFYCYPNPAERFTQFRFEILDPSTESSVSIDIFDQAGNHISELSENVIPGIPQEIKWDLDKVGSGIYWARLKIDGIYGEVDKMIRVAVVK